MTIIGDTYHNGYKMICSRCEVAVADIGLEPIDCNIWEKSNQKYTPHPLRFLNSYERILVFRKPGGKSYFEEIMKPSSSDGYKAKPNSSGGYYISSPESCITNVIRTSTHDPRELRKVEGDFRHDAPAPEKIYRDFISAYSKPGDTIIDGFVGSGTIGVGLTMGRNVIGYDVDYESIEFCSKRFNRLIKEKTNNLSIAA